MDSLYSEVLSKLNEEYSKSNINNLLINWIASEVKWKYVYTNIEQYIINIINIIQLKVNLLYNDLSTIEITFIIINFPKYFINYYIHNDIWNNMIQIFGNDINKYLLKAFRLVIRKYYYKQRYIKLSNNLSKYIIIFKKLEKVYQDVTIIDELNNIILFGNTELYVQLMPPFYDIHNLCNLIINIFTKIININPVFKKYSSAKYMSYSIIYYCKTSSNKNIKYIFNRMINIFNSKTINEYDTIISVITQALSHIKII